jgi:hypothetical protein
MLALAVAASALLATASLYGHQRSQAQAARQDLSRVTERLETSEREADLLRTDLARSRSELDERGSEAERQATLIEDLTTEQRELVEQTLDCGEVADAARSAGWNIEDIGVEIGYVVAFDDVGVVVPLEAVEEVAAAAGELGECIVTENRRP